jgi:hypothetical protein
MEKHISDVKVYRRGPSVFWSFFIAQVVVGDFVAANLFAE